MADMGPPERPASAPSGRLGSWRHTLAAAFAKFNRDQATDLAASLTYYSVLALFPALLALVSLFGVFGQGDSTVQALLQLLNDMGQGEAAHQLEGPISSMVNAGGAGAALVIGIAGALWSASGYVGAFARAMNRIYAVPEGRPMVRLRLQQLAITLVLIILAGLVLLGLVMSGSIAQAVGGAIGFGDEALAVWGWAKWPVIVVVVVGIVAILYYATPNVRQPRFRWLSVGAAVAILVWAVVSTGFGYYVTNFGSYNRTYGSLAGIIVFLLWLWLTNVALLFGAEVDVELERTRELRAGIHAERTVQLAPRDTRASDAAAEKLREQVAAGRRLREEAVGARDPEAYAGERARLEPLPSQRERAQGRSASGH
jgi:membrane protein